MAAEEANATEMSTQICKKMKDILHGKIVQQKKEFAREFMLAVTQVMTPDLEPKEAEALVDKVMDQDDDWNPENIPMSATIGRCKNLFYNYDCPICGSKIRYRSKARHERTIKHRQAEEVWQTRFEMTQYITSNIK